MWNSHSSIRQYTVPSSTWSHPDQGVNRQAGT